MVKVAVNDVILSEGVSAAQYRTETPLKVSCLWPSRVSCRASSTPQTQGAHVMLNDIDKTPHVLSCVNVLAGSNVPQRWYESTISYRVTDRSISIQCSFDDCGASASLMIGSG